MKYLKWFILLASVQLCLGQQDNWKDVFVKGGDSNISVVAVNENGNPIGVDPSTRSAQTIDYAHNKVAWSASFYLHTDKTD